MSSQLRSQKLLQELVSHELTAYLSICNLFKLSELWQYYQNHVNQIILTLTTLKLSFTNIWGLCSNFCWLWIFTELNSPDILALSEIILNDSIDSGNFSVRGFLPLMRKDSSTHTHRLSVYVTEGLLFAQELSLENYLDSALCFQLALFHSVSYFFFLYRSPSSSLWTFFDFILSYIDGFSCSTHLLMCLETLMSIITTGKNLNSPLLGNVWKLNTPPYAIITIPMWTLLLG